MKRPRSVVWTLLMAGCGNGDDTSGGRVHLMDDTANRNMFYGPNCRFCTDTRNRKVMRNLMNR